MKIKNVVLLALLAALYMVLYMVAMAIAWLLGYFGHAISPGICGLLTGAIIIFINRKVKLPFQYSLFTAIIMGIFALMGGGYLPWLITSMTAAIIADLMVSRDDKASVLKLAVASGILHVGQAFGAILPAIFMVEQYRAEWISRGQTAAGMEAMIQATTGVMGILATIITFVLAFGGVYIGYHLLKKHLKED